MSRLALRYLVKERSGKQKVAKLERRPNGNGGAASDLEVECIHVHAYDNHGLEREGYPILLESRKLYAGGRPDRAVAPYSALNSRRVSGLSLLAHRALS